MVVSSLYQQLSVWFWNENVWLPSNITWADLQKNQHIQNAKFSDLYITIPLAFALFALRFAVERLVFKPIARLYGVKDVARTIKPNVILEKAYKEKATNKSQVQNLAKEINWSEERVRAWLFQRTQLWKPNKFQKLKECGWRMTFYGCIFIYGLVSLWNKPWLWDTRECWSGGFIYQTVDPEIRWYYLIELAFYLSLVVSQFTDVQRKDFWQMMIHHIATLILMGGSWILNGVRMGSLILLCHDAADIPMEAAKFFKYIGKKKMCTTMFVVFLLTWFPTRLVIFPYKLMLAGISESWYQLAPAPYYILNGSLVLLFLLHIMWTWMIVRILTRVMNQGQLDDVRSDSEDSDDEKSKDD